MLCKSKFFRARSIKSTATERSATLESVRGSRVTNSCGSGGGGLVWEKIAGTQSKHETSRPESRIVMRIRTP